jgi:hypothetical protein
MGLKQRTKRTPAPGAFAELEGEGLEQFETVHIVWPLQQTKLDGPARKMT